MVGVYERWILPRLLDLSMRNRLLDHYRQRTIETAQGLVLEVGVGSGVNLRFYSRTVDRVFGIDLSPELLRLAHERRRMRLFRCRCSELLRKTCPLLMRYSIQS